MRHSEGGKMRNLDEIQEDDSPPRGPRLGALALASVGGACILFASFLLLRHPAKPGVDTKDPLGDLVAKTRNAPPSDSVGVDVTFPRLLSDGRNPTTALEAMRGNKPVEQDDKFVLPPGSPNAPPIASDRLPVVPLPAQDILTRAGEETVSKPTDVLSTMARNVSRDTGTEVDAGSAGGFQLQVSSFNNEKEANDFAAALRRRGHRAYVESAVVGKKGTWYRVRIGPFKYKRSAETYRQEFEAKERLVTFIVSPPKTTVRVAQSQSQSQSHSSIRESDSDDDQ